MESGKMCGPQLEIDRIELERKDCVRTRTVSGDVKLSSSEID